MMDQKLAKKSVLMGGLRLAKTATVEEKEKPVAVKQVSNYGKKTTGVARIKREKKPTKVQLGVDFL